jgi:acetylornithine deacetylase/succinyl-diaminopimelate desuccinylase-like protein
MLTALLRLSESDALPPGDIVLAALSDEEGGSEYGARFLVEKHAELFAGIRYAIGEFGGIARPSNAGNVYLVPVAEKQWCTLRVHLRGSGGHGSLPTRGGALASLARLLTTLDQTRLPFHLPAISEDMIDAYAHALTPTRGDALRGLKDPERAGQILDDAGGALALFDAALHNTVTPTILRAGDRVDAVPDAVELELDARVLPDQTPDALLDELRAICGDELTIEVTRVDEPPTDRVDTGLLGALAPTLDEVDGTHPPRPSVPSAQTCE